MKHRQVKNKEKNHLSKLNKEYRKQFFRNLKTACEVYTGYDLFSKLPVSFLETIFENRVYRININPDVKQFNKKERIEAVEHFSSIIDITSIKLPNGQTIPLGIHLEEGYSLFRSIRHCEEDAFPEAAEVKKMLSIYLNREQIVNVTEATMHVLSIYSLLTIEISTGYTWGKFELEKMDNGGLKNVFALYKEEPVKEMFVVDGKPRPAYQVGWTLPVSGLFWPKIEASLLGLPKDEEPLPIFIQVHALNRLSERIGLPAGSICHFLIASLLKPEYYIDKKGTIKVAMYYYISKIGYLVCTIENHRLLIHTFLFLTNGGTPEGEKLNKLTGLKTMDKKYIAIDRLQTFLSYNIEENEFVKNIFAEAGCGHLFEMTEEKKYLLRSGKTQSVEFIVNYLLANSPERISQQLNPPDL